MKANTEANSDLSLPAIAILAVAALLYGLYARYYYVGLINDDAAYVLAAQSLLRGKYAMLFLPGQPAMTAYPPGYPLFLAPWVALVQPNWGLLKYLSFVLTLSNGVLLWMLAKSWLPSRLRLLALALFALNPITAGYAGTVMSEPLFIAFILMSFLLLRRILEGKSRWEIWALGLTLGYACLIRSAGVLTIPCVAMGLLYAKRYREALQASLIALFMLGLFILRNYLVAGTPTGYSSALVSSLVDVLQPMHLLRHFIAVTNIIFATTLLALPSLSTSLGRGMYTLGGIAMGSLFLLIYSREAKTSLKLRALTLPILAFIFSNYALYSIWNAPLTRYALPLLPFLALLLVTAFNRLTPHRHINQVLALLIMGLTVTYTYGHYSALRDLSALSQNNAYLAPRSSWQWISVHLPQDAQLMSAKCPETYLYTERVCIGPMNAQDVEQFRYKIILSGSTHIVSRPFDIQFAGFNVQDDWQKNRRWAASWPEAFKRVYDNASEETTIYEVRPNSDFQKAYELYTQGLQSLNASSIDQGLQKLDQSLARYPLASALNAYGAAYLLTHRDLGKSETVLRQALQIHPLYVPALLNLGRVYSRKGNPGKAREFFLRAGKAVEQTGEFPYLFPVIEKELHRL